jgi:hypothetical protein
MSDAPASNRPSHKVFITREYQQGKEIKTNWLEVGVAWQHKNGEGMNIKIHDGMSVHGNLTIIKPRENAGAGAETTLPGQDEDNILFN